ncbi:MAG: exodeoxyribonuclease VII large subunit [Blastomonas sp.]|nr:exodeoxyribonuclease VII large subunit [Blastomonas sp.]
MSSRSGGLLAQMPPGDNAPPLSVSEISGQLKRMVEDRFSHVRIRGEISGFKRAASGHCYLALKDDKAVIDGIIWKGTTQRLPFRPEDGLDVIATGKLTTFPGRSKYQITIESLELAGEGALMQLFEKLKARLAAEGLFDPERKRALPFLPRTIGVVTSPTGSVIRDILHRLADRFPSHVLVWPVLVQGEGAAGQVAAAVRGFGAMPQSERPDLLIVARGGGSIEDLWAFNEEPVVRAIAESVIPVISAVGHETDTTLADFAADRRAPTPTAAAEMAVPVRSELLGGVAELGLRASRAVNRSHALARERLEARAQRLPRLADLLSPQQQRADDLGERLRAALGLQLAHARGALARTSGALRPAVLDTRVAHARDRLARLTLDPAVLDRITRRAGERLAGLERVLAQLDPDAPLQRGYARVTAGDGRTLIDKAVAVREPRLTLHFRDGTLDVAPADGPPPPPVSPTPAAKTKPRPAEPRQASFL